MPFNIDAFINNSIDNVLASKLMHTIASNPIYTALIIALIVMLSILIIFANADSDLATLTIRAGFWVFLATCGVMFLHNKIIIHEYLDKKNAGNYTEIIDDSLIADRDEYIPVNINTNFANV